MNEVVKADHRWCSAFLAVAFVRDVTKPVVHALALIRCVFHIDCAHLRDFVGISVLVLTDILLLEQSIRQLRKFIDAVLSVWTTASQKSRLC